MPDTNTTTVAPAIDFSAIKGLLFDIDGTLCNSDPLHFKAFQEILTEAGFDGGKPITEAFFRQKVVCLGKG